MISINPIISRTPYDGRKECCVGCDLALVTLKGNGLNPEQKTEICNIIQGRRYSPGCKGCLKLKEMESLCNNLGFSVLEIK